MVSWMFAFKKGLKIFLWSIVWAVVGGIVGCIAGGGALFTALPAMRSGDPSVMIGAIIGILAGGIAGGLITSIGIYATIVKITLESVKESGQ